MAPTCVAIDHGALIALHSETWKTAQSPFMTILCRHLPIEWTLQVFIDTFSAFKEICLRFALQILLHTLLQALVSILAKPLFQ